MEPNRAARLQEIELKRQRLAEMRARRQEGEQSRSTALRAPLQELNASRRETTSREELETLLRGIGAETKQSPPTANDMENYPPTSTTPSDSSTSTETAGSRDLSLEMTKIRMVDVAFNDKINYSKGMQTEAEIDDFRERIHSDEIETTLAVEDSDDEPTVVEEKKHQEPLMAFSEDEKKQVLRQDDFQIFFRTASKWMERVLYGDDERDLIDYSSVATLEKQKNNDLLTLFSAYTEPNWTENRSVVGMSFGKQQKELVVVAYDADRDHPLKPAGIVCVWNTRSQSPSPEFVHHSTSSLTSVTFAHDYFILAGCYSGQIVVWDTRNVTKKTPVNKTQLTNRTHTQPIFNLNVVGTSNSHSVCTVSSDGKLGIWNIDSLAQPIFSQDFQDQRSRSVPILSVSFCSDEADSFVAGSENGKIYVFNKNTAGNIQASEEFEGQIGPVHALHTHRSTGVIDFSHLFLAATSDGSIKLWSIKDPLFAISLEGHEDMITDVKWSPVHPAVFASSDLKGLLLLWNLNVTTENPVLTVDVTKGEAPLKKLAWSEDGRKICVGDSKGVIYVYDTHESLYSVGKQEFIEFAKFLVEVKKRAEEEAAPSSRLAFSP